MSWNKHRERLQFVLIAILAGALVYVATRPATVTVVDRVPVEVANPASPMGATGWVDDAEIREPIAATMLQFSDTPAFKAVRGEEPKDVYLWEAHRRLYGFNPPARNQGNVGSCVSFGTAAAIEHTLANQVLLGFVGEYRDIAQEVIYAGSRVEIGGGRIRGDGSVGAWAAKFVTQYGVIARGVVGRYDLGKYNEARCRDWGRTGVPDDIEPEVKRFPVGDAAKVKTWTEAKKALQNAYGIAICSNVGLSDRDSRGISRERGQWNHCMALVGYHIDTDGKEYGFILNSWGEFEGPVGWGSPSKAGYWVESKTINKMLSQDDSFAFSGVTGFPPRKIDWDVRAKPRRKADFNFAQLQPDKVLAW